MLTRPDLPVDGRFPSNSVRGSALPSRLPEECSMTPRNSCGRICAFALRVLSNRFGRSHFFANFGVAAVGLLAFALSASPADAQLKISQIYGGNISGATGTTQALYRSDYVEIYNPTGAPVTMTNWGLQTATTTGSTWTVVTLNGTVPANGYWLVALLTSTNTTHLPTPPGADTTRA